MINRLTLADFIESNTEEIVSEAQVFASSLLPEGVHLDAEALRDHIPEILSFVVLDLRTSQTASQSQTKAEGRGPLGEDASAASWHGRLRAKSGFNVDQMVAEYRALRASVLRLWLEENIPDKLAFEEMIRFNEAIDQAIAESVSDFSTEAEAWRQVFLGVLGHDLRGPLSVIMMTSELMAQMVSDTPYSKQAARLIQSGQRMQQLLDDLLDYSRTSLGMGIRVNRTEGRLADAVVEEVKDLQVNFPHSRIELVADSETFGSFDFSRIREALNNLVSNAVKYGTKDGLIQVSLTGINDEIHLTVKNEGAPLTAAELQSMFEPLKRRPVNGNESLPSLGLGLFIVREIAKAHGGDVIADSSKDTTTMTMRLIRNDVLNPQS